MSLDSPSLQVVARRVRERGIEWSIDGGGMCSRRWLNGGCSMRLSRLRDEGSASMTGVERDESHGKWTGSLGAKTPCRGPYAHGGPDRRIVGDYRAVATNLTVRTVDLAQQ